MHVPIELGCGSPSVPALCPPGTGPFPSLWVTKAANFPNATFPGVWGGHWPAAASCCCPTDAPAFAVTGVLGVTPIPGSPAPPLVSSTVLAQYLVPQVRRGGYGGA